MGKIKEVYVSDLTTAHKLTPTEAGRFFKRVRFDLAEVDELQFGEIIRNGHAFKHTEGHGGTSGKDTFHGFQFVTIDIDNKRPERTYSLNDIIEATRWGGAIPTYTYETYSSTPEHPRYRLVYLFDSFVEDSPEGEKYKRIVGQIAHTLEERIEEDGVVDKASFNYTQVMYAGQPETVTYTHAIHNYETLTNSLPTPIYYEPKKGRSKESKRTEVSKKYTIPTTDDEARAFLSNPYTYHKGVTFSMTYSNKPIANDGDLYTVQDEDLELLALPHDNRRFKDGQKRKMKIRNWVATKWRWMFSGSHPKFEDYRTEVLGFASYLISRYIDNNDGSLTPMDFLDCINKGIRYSDSSKVRTKSVKFNMGQVKREIDPNCAMSKEERDARAMDYVRRNAQKVVAQHKRDKKAFLVDTDKSFEWNCETLGITPKTLRKIIKENGLYVLTEKQMEREEKLKATREYVVKNHKWSAYHVAKTIKDDEYLNERMLSKYEVIKGIFEELGYDTNGSGCEGQISRRMNKAELKIEELKDEILLTQLDRDGWKERFEELEANQEQTYEKVNNLCYETLELKSEVEDIKTFIGYDGVERRFAIPRAKNIF